MQHSISLLLTFACLLCWISDVVTNPLGTLNSWNILCIVLVSFETISLIEQNSPT